MKDIYIYDASFQSYILMFKLHLETRALSSIKVEDPSSASDFVDDESV